ncbi:MAG: HD-GYP domain-containing protein [Actinomycetes bacterium]
MPRKQASVIAFVAVLFALAITGLLLTATRSVPWSSVAAFTALFWLCASFTTRVRGHITVSTSFVVGLAAVLVVGPFGAGLVGLSDGLKHLPGMRPIQRLFNAAQMSLAGVLSGLVVRASFSDNKRLLHAGASSAALIAATILIVCVFHLVNTSLVAAVVSLDEGLPIHRVWRGSQSWGSAAYLAYGLLGLLMAVLWVRVSLLAGVFVLIPILVARQTFAQYAAEREEYDATVRALIQSVETKDYYTRGHSERVSRATVLIAREWGLREDRVNVIRYAGLLHDVGKLGVPTKVLQKQGKLNDAEFDAIKLHPMRGYEMLREIRFLEEALTGVVHHHERMDGKGYPMGLVAEEIPEFARIIMVADAFDSMTSTRSYRAAKNVEEAITELRKWQGQQFDPYAVEALVRALEKNEWEPHPEPFHGELVARDGSLLPRPSGAPNSERRQRDTAPGSEPRQVS